MKWELIIYIGGVILVFGIVFLLMGGEMRQELLNPVEQESQTLFGSFDTNDTRGIGYEFLDNDNVVHIWNTEDDYFFEKDAGIQLTNHYQDYWTRNVFCIGYYNEGEWNKIYCADELTNFNKNIDTDNETYVNATLWKDVQYGAYDIRLGINYYLGLNDKNLSITIYGKNIGIDIPFDLGFAWKITEWDIPPSERDDYIKINNTNYLINSFNDDIIFKNMDNTFIKGFDNRESLRVDWDESLNYAVKMFGNGVQEDFYVALLINAGHFNPNQEKSTTFQWIDLIAVDDISDGTDSGTTTLTVEHTTTGTATNGILIVTVQVTDSSETDRIINNVTFNNVELTHLPVDADDLIEQRTEIWYLTNPEETTANIVVTAAGSCTDLTLGAISLTGVDSTGFFNICDSYNEDNENDFTQLSTAGDGVAQSFTGNGERLLNAKFFLRGAVTPVGTVDAYLYEHTGTFGTSSKPADESIPLATSTNTIDISTLAIAPAYGLATFNFDGTYTLVSGTKYIIAIKLTTRDSGRIDAGIDGTPSHAGNPSDTEDDGATWTALASDLIFYVYTGNAVIQTAKHPNTGPPTLDITTVGTSSYVIDSLAIAESDGTKIATGTAGGQIIHKTDVGGDTHAASYVDAGGAGVQEMNYTDTDSDKSWVMSAVSISVLVEAGGDCWGYEAATKTLYVPTDCTYYIPSGTEGYF